MKTIFKVDLSQSGVTDVSNRGPLPTLKADLATPPDGLGPIIPLSKTQVINLLASKYVVATGKTIKDVIAEKVEGMAWGPDRPNGHHLLYVITDNDLYTGYLPNTTPIATQIYAFEIDGALAHIDYQPATLPGPMFPPGQVKKILTR